MKKVLLSLGMVFMATGFAMAQDSHVGHNHGTTTTAAAPAPAAAPQAKTSTTLTTENMSFTGDVHEFGNLPEGPSAEHEFKFKNTGKEPIIISNVTASCGCTTPSYSKEPVLPGKTGSIKAVYSTQGRVGPFTKAITVVSNAGTKVLTIKGTVDKAPENSVPANKSMVKTN
mgnify:CR=1 FL=1